MIWIIIALGVAAIYCGAAYALLFVTSLIASSRRPISPAEQIEIERTTFHLGLCFILAVGFLGLLLK